MTLFPLTWVPHPRFVVWEEGGEGIHLHAVVSVLPVCAVPWRPLTSSAMWFVLDDYWWLSLRKKGGLESNNCICLRKFNRSKMGGLDTICSWQTMSPWANFFIFLCLAFPGITGELKNELGKSTNLRNVYLKRFKTVTYIRSLSTVGRKPDCTECKWILVLFSSYFLSSKHKSSNKVNLVICIILNRSVTGIDLMFFFFFLI